MKILCRKPVTDYGGYIDEKRMVDGLRKHPNLRPCATHGGWVEKARACPWCSHCLEVQLESEDEYSEFTRRDELKARAHRPCKTRVEKRFMA